jgi:hypothetical protein
MGDTSFWCVDGVNLMGKNINTWKKNTDGTLHKMLNAVG